MLLNRSPSLLCVKYRELLFSKRIWMEGRFHALVPHNRTFFFYHQVVLSAVIGAFFAYIGWRVVRWFGLRSFMIRARVCRMIQAFFFPYWLFCKGYLAPSSLLIGCKQIDDWLFFFYYQVVVSAVIRVFFFCNAREQNTPSKRIPRERPFKFIL